MATGACPNHFPLLCLRVFFSVAQQSHWPSSLDLLEPSFGQCMVCCVMHWGGPWDKSWEGCSCFRSAHSLLQSPLLLWAWPLAESLANPTPRPILCSHSEADNGHSSSCRLSPESCPLKQDVTKRSLDARAVVRPSTPSPSGSIAASCVER